MFFTNSNIYAKEWLDIIFADRNKAYGAYELRRVGPQATNWALGIVTAAVLGLCGVAYAFQNNHPNNPSEKTQEQVMIVEIQPDEILEIEKPIEQPKSPTEEQPQQVAQDVPAQDLIKFTEINATDESLTNEDMVATEDVLDKKKLPANLTMDGVKGGELIAKGTFGKEKKAGGGRGLVNGSLTGPEDGNGTFTSVEIMPEPIGGMKAFVQWVADNYNFPQGALDSGAKGIIKVAFVVEKDGSLSSFEVVKDMGYGTGTAAVHLLKKAKKWNPGVQNGRPVRVAFTLPIRLSITQN
ncbi:energy transducer TonB [Sphingobacterium sp. SGG-5]|uniref:energy transducer TonB n=1 Tax=Sphingobacterium sp. SGG-5 TaxID=2710881 RepID=UPI0013ECD87A|nr:energy transducer TonB [Sphingobacterium sp. SGG-5]NGM60382.1 energy transducer TonB [Sphingobacterium sp. SGG-5]